MTRARTWSISRGSPMNYQNPYFSFAAVRWYDWLGVLTLERMKSRWEAIEMLPKIFDKTDLKLLLEEDLFSDSDQLNDKQFQLALWKESLIIEDKMVCVDHVKRLVHDYLGVHELDSWYADFLLRDLDTKKRHKVVPLIESVQKVQASYDALKAEANQDFEKVLWESYIKNFPNEDEWFPIITKII